MSAGCHVPGSGPEVLNSIVLMFICLLKAKCKMQNYDSPLTAIYLTSQIRYPKPEIIISISVVFQYNLFNLACY